MDRLDKQQIDRLCRYIESIRPSWRVSYSEEGDDLIMISVSAPKGSLLRSPLPFSIERATEDFRSAAQQLLRVLDARAKAGY